VAEPGAGRPADQGGPGRTTIAPRVVERLAVAAAREVDATAAARGGLTGLIRGELPRASAVVAGNTSRVSVQIAVHWPESLADVAGRTRRHVTERVAALAGVDVTACDVSVAEVVHRSDLTPRVQ
jgi:uncharacterized alkaline shock family protein YloU